MLPGNGRKEAPPGFFATALSLGMNMAAGVAVFTAIGYYLDQKRGGGKAWTLCGIFMGLFYGGYEVWKVVREIERRYSDDQKTKNGPK